MKTSLLPKEFKVIALRECAGVGVAVANDPYCVADYWRKNIANQPTFSEYVESLWVLAVNTRRRVTGQYLVATGTLDTILCHPREVFRAAVIAGAAAVILVHNHPSGDPSPSDGDIKATRDMIRAGELLNIQVLDHVVIGDTRIQPRGHTSLRELGYFYPTNEGSDSK
jgi:DNA repair protein RadC